MELPLVLMIAVVLLGNAVDVTPSAGVDTAGRLSVISERDRVKLRSISAQVKVSKAC